MGKRVLVVEDNELNLKLFCDLLRVHGHVPEAVRDGREAHARTGAFQPDLIIMDIQLPHVSGLDLITLLKGDEQLRHIPIMAVTAFAAKGDEERIREAGAEAYVSKPISVMKFTQSVNGLLETVREGAEPEAKDDAPDTEKQTDDTPNRHPRESGDPASPPSETEEEQPDSRVRGNDEEEEVRADEDGEGSASSDDRHSHAGEDRYAEPSETKRDDEVGSEETDADDPRPPQPI